VEGFAMMRLVSALPAKDILEWDTFSDYFKGFRNTIRQPTTGHRKPDFGGGPRSRAACFSIGAKGYVGTGLDNSNCTKIFWNTILHQTPGRGKQIVAGTPRFTTVSFNIDNIRICRNGL
jgi:hypothetical protein